MKNVTVTPEQFEKAVYKALAEYGDKVYDKTDKIAKSTARQTTSALKANSAGGKFAKGWSRRAQKGSTFETSQIVFNREYQLVHLQEKEHDTGKGANASHYPKHVDYTGRIAEVEEKYTQQFMEEVISKL